MRLAWISLLFVALLLSAGPVCAQDSAAPDARAAEPRTVVEEDAPPAAGSLAGRIELRFVFSNVRSGVEVGHLKYKPPAAFGDPPYTTRMANHRTDYLFEETGGRLEVRYNVLDYLSVGLGLGFVSTDFSLEARNGNLFGFTGGTFTHVETTAGGDSPGLVFNFDVGGDFPLGDSGLFAGANYALRFGTIDYRRQSIFGINQDAEMDWLSHDVRLKFGFMGEIASVWAGLSFNVFDAEMRVKDKRDFLEPDIWEFDLGATNPVRGLVGFALHPTESVRVSVEGVMAPALSIDIGVGYSF